MEPLDQHRARRIAALAAPDGWLNLVARIDLTPGTHRVGAGQEVQLPSGPDLLGTLVLGPRGASFARPGEAPRDFQPVPDGFPLLQVDPFLLEIHTVDGVPALRVRDLTLRPGAEIRYFPDAPNWVIRATWDDLAPEQAKVTMKDGSTATVTLTHSARFVHDGHQVTLTPTHWKGGKPMFVFRDATAGETYAAGRFLIGEDAVAGTNGKRGEITLDFNRAFTPPCGFTDFAICPLPPPGNILPFRVEAGEKTP
ncbi:MAG: DUF1684 domain-containing protein [Paracoccaceae bacterium]